MTTLVLTIALAAGAPAGQGGDDLLAPLVVPAPQPAPSHKALKASPPAKPGPAPASVAVPSASAQFPAADTSAPFRKVSATLPPPPLLSADSLGLSSRVEGGLNGWLRTPAARVTGWTLAGSGTALLAAGIAGMAYCLSVNDAVSRQQPGGPDFSHPTVSKSQYQSLSTLYPLSLTSAVLGLGAAGTGAFILARPSGGATAGLTATF